MTLLDAKDFDPEKERKKRARIILITVVVLIVAGLLWWFRYWPEEHVVGQFFNALQKQDYKTAYGIWMHDPEWSKHPAQYSKYPFADFYRDWGPSSEWGIIKTQKVFGAAKCPSEGAGTSGTGIVVDVIVNDRVQHADVWVEKSDHTLSYPPCDLIFR